MHSFLVELIVCCKRSLEVPCAFGFTWLKKENNNRKRLGNFCGIFVLILHSAGKAKRPEHFSLNNFNHYCLIPAFRFSFFQFVLAYIFNISKSRVACEHPPPPLKKMRGGGGCSQATENPIYRWALTPMNAAGTSV